MGNFNILIAQICGEMNFTPFLKVKFKNIETQNPWNLGIVLRIKQGLSSIHT